MKVARLVQLIVPTRYTLDLTIDMERFTSSGRETIQFELMKPSRCLVFHGVGLKLTAATLHGGAQAPAITTSVPDQTITFEFDDELPMGSHTLSFDFMGEVSESLHGLYRSQYERDGEKMWLATTQFEPIHAREAFVCIDEPAAKAVFEISLTVPAAMKALSNASVAAETVSKQGYKTVTFAPTLKMSTYLVAFIVGDLEYVEQVTHDNTVIRVYATPGKTNQLAFALEATVNVLAYFNDYFGIAYPLPKLDLVAIPDFSAGAMENWGVITFRETALLIDPDKASLSHMQRVADVVAHELAHQWFGNLVTMSWWDDLWLNEGFASWSKFVESEFDRAQRLDSLKNTHPIQVEVDDPRALDEIFDAISYSKGASILNMLHHYIGADSFKQGLHDYLTEHRFGNSTTDDLWKALGKASGKPVARVMSAWTSQPGFPLLSWNDKQLTQRRFFRSMMQTPVEDSADTVWPIPFSSITEGGHTTEPILFDAPSMPVPDTIKIHGWVKPNPEQTAFYRTHYTGATVKALTSAIQQKTLGATDRYGIISDLFATCEAGITPVRDVLELITGMRDEDDYIVWGAICNGLGSLLGVIEDETLRGALENFSKWLLQPIASQVGWEPLANEGPFTTLLRPMILREAVRYDNEDITSRAKKLFATYLDHGQIDPNLRPVAFYAAARYGNKSDYDLMLEHYRSESSPQVKTSLLVALGQFQNSALIARYLDLGLSDDVRSQDSYIVLATTFTNRAGRTMAWEWLTSHWDVLLDRYGAGGHMLERFPVYAAHGFATHSMASVIKSFFESHPHPTITRPVAQALESIEAKVRWYERSHTEIETFLINWNAKQLDTKS
jgi:puromycin-sensitive aminopeptidase